MCKSIKSRFVAGLVGVLTAGLFTSAFAQTCQFPAGEDQSSCFTPAVGIGIFADAGLQTNLNARCLVVGEGVFYQLTVNQGAGCAISNGVMAISLPGSGTSVGIDLTPTGGIGTICNPVLCIPPNAPGCCPASSVPSVTSTTVFYLVKESDINSIPTNTATGSPESPTCSTPANPCGANPTDIIEAVGVYGGPTAASLSGLGCGATAQNSKCSVVARPCLSVTKLVACSTDTTCSATSDAFTPAHTSNPGWADDGNNTLNFCYSIQITNTGTALIQVTNVTDTILGDVTPAFQGAPNSIFVSPGHSIIGFVGPHAAPSADGHTVTNINDTATVRAVELASGFTFPVTCGKLSDSATGTVFRSHIKASISFVQNGQTLTGNSCPDAGASCPGSTSAFQGNGPVAVHVTACADGNNGQTIGTLFATVAGNSGSFTIPGNIGTLNGQCAGDVVVTNISSIGCSELDVTVHGVGALSDGCGLITGVGTNKLEICGTNCLQIVKLVKCTTSNECVFGCSPDIGLYTNHTVGVQSAEFCYLIVVHSPTLDVCPGNQVLSNVVVTDVDDSGLHRVPQLGSLDDGDSISTNVGTLLPGDTATITYQRGYVNVLGPVNNTATAAGTTPSGASLSVSSNASVNLIPINIFCRKKVNGNYDTDSILLPSGVTSTAVTFSVEVSNDGSVDLQNVTVSDVGACATNNLLVGDGFLAVGQTNTVTLCTTNLLCNQSAQDTVTVSGDAVSSATTCGVVNVTCGNISTNHTCNGSVSVSCPTPTACRTTGGGKQTNTCQSSLVPTAKAQYVTHGGQVGAPIAIATTCQLSTPCIWGEWQHVRHLQPRLDGVLHASGNKKTHDFDSLECACLPCPEFATTNPACAPFGATGPCLNVNLDYTSTNALTQGKRFALCDVDQPRICGAEPRPAPDNKICFSGIGNYALTHGKKTKQSVVFRVDIEDRGEPGNAKAIVTAGKANPPDRYRMRIWFVDPKFGRKDLPPTDTLRCMISCQDPLAESLCPGTPCPDIDDGGDLNNGNRQIHPVTGNPFNTHPDSTCGPQFPCPSIF